VLQNQQQDGNEADAILKCPTCRGKIDLKKIIDYATFKKVHKPDEASKNDDNAVIDDDGTESETDSNSSLASATESEDDADRNGDLRDFVVPDDIEDTDEEKGDAGDDGDDEAEVPKRKSKSKKAKKNKRQKTKKGKDKKEKKSHVSLAMLKAQASRSWEARRAYMKYLRKHWQPSAKVDKCIELLEQFQNNEKTIVFSQFVSLLDLVQVPIDRKGWKVQRYDGAMSADARNDAVIQFTDNPNVKIMLISLKAGNYGLNLVAASRVIILDPFWNPFIEMQAVDRAYRIGQQKPVEVHRILIKDTVEDRIIKLQEKKRKLVDSALDEGAGKALSRLDVHQLAFLFGVGARPE
jgi:SNF2 family DNA or RNA helicase